jgi:hypothetical protein
VQYKEELHPQFVANWTASLVDLREIEHGVANSSVRIPVPRQTPSSPSAVVNSGGEGAAERSFL